MKLSVLMLLLLVVALPSLAQTTWTGTTSTDWNTASNWNTNAVPTTTSDVVISNVTNDPVIGAGVAALAKSVEVQIGASLTIITTGSLTIHGARSIAGFTTAFSNKGTVYNSGQLVMGSVASVGEYGLWNQGFFNNKTGGVIQIDVSTTAGLYNELVATFINEASLVIGAIVSVGTYGLLNEGNFFNNQEGAIHIDRSTTAGLYNDFATFNNNASLVIGATASVGEHSLLNEGNFFNNQGGTIHTDRSTTAGLYNGFVGTFNNNASLVIRSIGSVGAYGLFNIATLLNGGQIRIDRSTQYGLVNELNTLGIGLDPFTNRGSIVIGSIASVGGFGFFNHAPFLNTGCATLSLFDPLSNADSFTNQGLFRVNTALAHTNSGLINNGILEYAQANLIPNVTNNDLLLAPIVTACDLTATPALQIGGSNRFIVGSTWYQEPALTTVAGSYSPNSFTATSLASGSTYPVSFTVSDPFRNCIHTVTIPVTVTAPSLSLTASGALSYTAPSVTLSATPGFSSYLFSSGATQPDGPGSSTATVSAAGVYSVTATNGDGCSTSAVVSVTGASAPPLVLSVSPSQVVGCVGLVGQLSVTARGGIAPYSYSWRAPEGIVLSGTSSSAVSGTLTSVGVRSISVVVSSAGGGPVSTATISVMANAPNVSISAAPSLTISTGQSATLTASGGSAYRWSTGPSSPAISVSTAGTYSVTATSSAGCRASTSAVVSVTSASGGRKAAEKAIVPLQVLVLGNPLLRGQVVVEVSGVKEQLLRYELMDVKGNLVNERQVDAAGTIDRQTLDLGGHSGGVFILRVSTSTQSQTVKVIRTE